MTLFPGGATYFLWWCIFMSSACLERDKYSDAVEMGFCWQTLIISRLEYNDIFFFSLSIILCFPGLFFGLALGIRISSPCL